ncbi:hypothetical protein DXG01_012973 [Tephrocybe rancida]|nr:hypothetical protein DXG01_012973 [Tephrocybe rancida]
MLPIAIAAVGLSILRWYLFSADNISHTDLLPPFDPAAPALLLNSATGILELSLPFPDVLDDRPTVPGIVDRHRGEGIYRGEEMGSERTRQGSRTETSSQWAHKGILRHPTPPADPNQPPRDHQIPVQSSPYHTLAGATAELTVPHPPVESQTAAVEEVEAGENVDGGTDSILSVLPVAPHAPVERGPDVVEGENSDDGAGSVSDVPPVAPHAPVKRGIAMVEEVEVGENGENDDGAGSVSHVPPVAPPPQYLRPRGPKHQSPQVTPRPAQASRAVDTGWAVSSSCEPIQDEDEPNETEKPNPINNRPISPADTSHHEPGSCACTLSKRLVREGEAEPRVGAGEEVDGGGGVLQRQDLPGYGVRAGLRGGSRLQGGRGTE